MVDSNPTHLNYPKLPLYRHLGERLQKLADQLLEQGKAWILRDSNDHDAICFAWGKSCYVGKV